MSIVRRRFTPAGFESYLRTLPRPTWCKAVSLHHTWSPDEKAWHGWSSFDGVVRYWQLNLGWTRFVHLFIALEDGEPQIYVCNPLTEHGTGVKGRNRDTLHIEHVWNGDRSPFDARLLLASHRVQRALSKWADIPLRHIDPNPAEIERGFFLHRDRHDAGKTCPGALVKANVLIARPEIDTSPERVQEDDMTKEERNLLRIAAYRALGASIRVEALAAKLDGDDTKFEELMAKAAKDVAKEKDKLEK